MMDRLSGENRRLRHSIHLDLMSGNGEHGALEAWRATIDRA